MLELAWAGVSLATWSYVIALGVYAFEAGGATAVGIVALVRLLPGALASPVAGVFGDRYSRRTMLAASALASAVALGASAAAVGSGAPSEVVYALAGLFTIASTPYVPAEGALLPSVSRTPQELAAANVAHSAMDNGGFLVGSALTGILLAGGSPEAVFAVAALVAGVATALLRRLPKDRRPEHVEADFAGVVAETIRGGRELLSDSSLRLIGVVLIVLVFVEGAADVLVVILALDELGLGQGSVGWVNAAWGIGALLATGALAVVLARGNLALGLVVGAVLAGAAMALPGAWPVVAAAYAGWFLIGIGYTAVEVAARTLLQRHGSDEFLARVLAFLETARLGAMALGSILAPALVVLLGTRGALVAVGALLPALAIFRWAALRSLETGAPVDERPYALLRGDPIFAPLPVYTLERLAHDAVPVDAPAGAEVITEGDRGDRFYLIDDGEVEVHQGGRVRGTQGEGESFGEIALVHDVPRTATVIAVCPTRLLALNREHFIAAVTGSARSREVAVATSDRRLADAEHLGRT
jgi:MFS family permease